MIDSTCCHTANSFFGESTGLYFYSAVFQGNMALLALVGVFVVFNLQKHQSESRDLVTRLEAFVRDHLNIRVVGHIFPLVFTSVRNLEERLLEISEGKNLPRENYVHAPEAAKKVLSDDQFKFIIREHKRIEERQTELRTALRIPLLWIIATIGLSLMMIPIATIAHRCQGAEAVLFIVTIALNAIALYFLLRLTKRAIQ